LPLPPHFFFEKKKQKTLTLKPEIVQMHDFKLKFLSNFFQKVFSSFASQNRPFWSPRFFAVPVGHMGQRPIGLKKHTLFC